MQAAQSRTLPISPNGKERCSSVSAAETRTRSSRASWESKKERSNFMCDSSCANSAWPIPLRSPLPARTAPRPRCENGPAFEVGDHELDGLPPRRDREFRRLAGRLRMTRVHLTTALLSLGFACCGMPAARSDELRVALVIANEDYESLPTLPRCSASAKTVGDALRGKGFKI